MSEHDDLSMPPPEEEAPRRAASARLEVRGGPGREAMLREALDPANQSLRDALRLSFRVLQLVMVVLVVVFLFSGLKTIEPGQIGLRLQLGQLEEEALEPGAHLALPFPAGDVIVLDGRGQSWDLEDAFMPLAATRRGTDSATDAASVNDFIRPGRDGAVLLQGADIGHLRLRGNWEVSEPARLLRSVDPQESRGSTGVDANRLVELLTERAVVHATAGRTLEELLAFGDVEQQEISASVQRGLDNLGSGLRVTSLEFPEDPLPALAIRREIQALEQARVNAARDVEIAREDAEAILIDVAGPQWASVNNAISAWQEADRFGGDVAAKQMAADAALEADDVSGQVASSLQMARAYASLVEVTLGQEARRHEGLLPAWREQRGLVASRMWSEVFANVMSTQDVEVVQVPEFGDFQLRLAGSDDVQELRRRMRLNEREAAQMIDGIDLDNPWLMGASMMQLQGPGRQLQRDSSSLNNPG